MRPPGTAPHVAAAAAADGSVPRSDQTPKGDELRSIRCRWIGLAGLVLLATSGCRNDARQQIESERQTADLVVGSAAAEWGLLTIPRRGGTPDLRPVVDPDSAVWNGSAELPVARGVWPVGESAAALLTEDGGLLRYSPRTDAVTRLVGLSAEARISGQSASAVVFVDSAGRFVYEVGADYAHAYRLDAPATWAGPIDGGVAVLLGDGTSRLLLLPRADSAEAVELPGAGAPPALVTAFGRRVIVTGPDGRSIRIYSTGEDAARVGEAKAGGTIRALAASPSSHEIYAALDDPPRLERISRFSLAVDELVKLDEPADAIRPGLFGGALLVDTRGGVARVRTGESVVASIGGQWRSDLPIGLPGDLTIVLQDDEARLTSVADSTSGTSLAGGAPRWWIPLRYNPSQDRDRNLRQALDEMGAQTGGAAAAAAAREDTIDATPDQGEAADVPEISRERAEAQEGPPGFYAIVASTRQREGVETLVASLAEAGYPTRIQTYPDEAGKVWHRALVGPFPSRARAQAAARQLLRERDLQAWVTEIGAQE